jgi:hypothetical protein
MSDELISLPPMRLRPDDDEENAKSVRRRAIERQTGQPLRRVKARQTYPSDLARRQRAITITLPEDEWMDYLREAAEAASANTGQEISTTRLATLILVAGLEQWRRGELVLARESEEVEKLTVKPAESA